MCRRSKSLKFRPFLKALEARETPATWTVDINNGFITGDDGSSQTVNGVPFTVSTTDSNTVREFRIRGNLIVPVNTTINFTNNPNNLAVRFFAGNDITVGAGTSISVSGVGSLGGPGGGTGGVGGVGAAQNSNLST